MAPLELLLWTAAQPAADVVNGTDHHDWPYWVAIGALSSALVTVFGLLMKSYRDRTQDQKDHAEDVKLLNKGFQEAAEARSKRVAEEFAKKDKAILEVSVDFAKLMERVAAELKAMNESGR